MRTIWVLLASIVVGSGFVASAKADDCCRCSSDKDKKRTFGGGWLSNEAACMWWCGTKTGNPSHSWKSGEKCEKPTGNPPSKAVIEALQLCRKTDSEKSTGDYGKCSGACEQLQSTRNACNDACKSDSGCISACSGACNVDGCNGACAGAAIAQNIAVHKDQCSNRRPCADCVGWLKTQENECVNGCRGNKGCEDSCHSVCFGNDSARSGACNVTEKSCPKPSKKTDRDTGLGGAGKDR